MPRSRTPSREPRPAVAGVALCPAVCNYRVAHWEGIVVQDRIEREVGGAAPPERVWEIITQAEHGGKWFGDSAEVALRPGGSSVRRWRRPGTPYRRIKKHDHPTPTAEYQR